MNLYDQIQTVYNTLNNRYNRTMIDKKELSREIQLSVSCINKRMKIAKALPEYKKGEGKCGRVRFPIINVARFAVESNIKIA